MVLQLMLLLMTLPSQLIELVHLVLVPVCFVVAWGLVGLMAWNTISAIRDGLSQATVMHKVPCAECRFFTNDYRLKCPIHPRNALSESAINCSDFEHGGFM